MKASKINKDIINTHCACHSVHSSLLPSLSLSQDIDLKQERSAAECKFYFT